MGTGVTSANWASPSYITPQQAEIMTEEQKESLIVYNETGEKLCGWKPAND